jgi:hypothetical protein
MFLKYHARFLHIIFQGPVFQYFDYKHICFTSSILFTVQFMSTHSVENLTET